MDFIGIDPGKSGAIAVIKNDGSIVTHVFDEVEYMNIVCNSPGSLAIVEDVHAMPKQGVSSMFSFGYNKGWSVGVLSAFGCLVRLVSPMKWKAHYGLLNCDKSASVRVAQSIFPGVNLFPTKRCKKPSDGIAEALLMAEYGRRTYIF